MGGKAQLLACDSTKPKVRCRIGEGRFVPPGEEKGEAAGDGEGGSSKVETERVYMVDAVEGLRIGWPGKGLVCGEVDNDDNESIV